MFALSGSMCDLEGAIESGRTYDDLCEAFDWQIPSTFNIAEEVCHRYADGSNRLALIAENESGNMAEYSFDELSAAAGKLASVMLAAGVQAGDRVAVVLPQRVETALVHLASLQIGAVSLPLSILFGDDALHYRLQDSGTAFLIVADERHRIFNCGRRALLTDRNSAPDFAATKNCAARY